MILTLEEKRNIAKHVIYSQNSMLINEAVDNNYIREEIKLNFAFYNAIKETFFKNQNIVIIEDILSLLSGAKDLLTGTDLSKKLIDWFTRTLVPLIQSKIGKFIPKSVQDVSSNLASYVSNFINWLKETLSYNGLAVLFAKIKYNKWLQSPSADEIKCMELAAKTAYRYILMTLVAAFVIKVLGYGGDLVIDAFTSDEVVIGSLDKLMTSVGLGKLFTSIFGTYGAATKAQKAADLKSKIETKRNEVQNAELRTFKDDWNYCDLKGK